MYEICHVSFYLNCADFCNFANFVVATLEEITSLSKYLQNNAEPIKDFYFAKICILATIHQFGVLFSLKLSFRLTLIVRFKCRRNGDIVDASLKKLLKIFNLRWFEFSVDIKTVWLVSADIFCQKM